MKRLYVFISALLLTTTLSAATFELMHESFESGSLPAGWTQQYVRTPITLGVDTAAFSWFVEKDDSLRNPIGAVEGTARVAARNTTPDEMRFVTRLITPQLNLASGLFQPQLVFSHAEPAYAGFSDTLRVYYRTSMSDIWHPYQTAVYTRNNTWKTEIMGVVAPSSTYQFAFEITENMGHGVVLDEIIVRSTPTCQNVTNVIASNIHAFDAAVSWTEDGAYNEFEVLVSRERITDFNNYDPSVIVQNIHNVYNTEVALADLNPETTYYVYVRSDCEETASGYTDWVEGSFTTLAVVYLPYTQNFNNIITYPGNAYFGMPIGWTTLTSSKTQCPFAFKGGTAAQRASFSVDSTAYLSFNGDFSATSVALGTDEYAMAVSPEIVTPSLQGLEIAFWATAYDKISSGSTSYAASLLVGVISDPADPHTFVPLDTVTIESAFQFKRFTVSLADYTGSAKFVALVSRFDKRNAIYVDNLTFTQPDVLVPTHVKVKNAHSTGLSVAADWTGADSWNLQISTEYARNGNVSPASILCSKTGLTAKQVDITLAESVLAGKTVLVYTQAVKNGVASDWSFPVTVRVPVKVTIPYTNSLESAGGQLLLKDMNHEVRTVASYQGVNHLYYLYTAMPASMTDAKSVPTLSSAKPNYRGAHAELNGNNTWFTLPEMDNISSLKLTFRYATADSKRGKLEVGVMTDPYDLSTFTHLATFSAENSIYTRALVSCDTYSGTGHFIAFRSLDAGVSEVASVNLIDEIVVEELGDCREASNVSINAKATEATLTWNGGNMDGWIVGISTIRGMRSAEYMYVTQPTATFQNLDPETTYYFTIQTICHGDTMDLDDVYYSFSTPRGLPFTERFQSYSFSSDWTVKTGLMSDAFNGEQPINSTSTSTSVSSREWVVSSSYIYPPQSGNAATVNLNSYVYSSYYYYDDDAYDCTSWLVSPVLQLGTDDIDMLELKFDLGIKESYSGTPAAAPSDKFAVLVSTDGGNTWSRQNATIWANDGTGDHVLNDLNWGTSQAINIDFTPYVGQRIQFAFYAEATSQDDTYDNYISIDNIELRVADPSCGGVSGLKATGTTATDAIIRWTLGGINPHPAIVQIATDQTFIHIFRTDTVQGTTLNLTDLAPSSTYYVRVRQACENNPDWVTASFHTLCDAITPEAFGTEDFSDANTMNCWTTGFFSDNGGTPLPTAKMVDQFGMVLNMSKATTDSTASDGAYAISPELDITDSITHYQVVFRAGSNSTLETNVHRLKVGVASDPSDPGYTFDPVATVNLALASDSMEMKTYVVSFENYIGDLDGNYGRYIMFLSEAGSDSTNFVCIDNVSIEPAQGCHQVLDFETSVVASDGATFTWSGNGASYEIMVTEHDVMPDTVSEPLVHAIVQGTTYTVSGLKACTVHYAYIRAICGDEDMSRWSSATRFRTSYGIPFFEGFDASTLATTGDWVIYDNLFNTDSLTAAQMHIATRWSTANTVNYSISSAVPGMEGYFARANIYSTYNGWFVTPALDLTHVEDASLVLSFKLAVTPYSISSSSSDTDIANGVAKSTDKRFGVIVSDDAGQTWKKANATFWACNGTGDYDFRTLNNHAQRFELDMTRYYGKTVQIAFYGESTGSSTDLYYFVDSIALDKHEAICLGAQNLTLELRDDTMAVAHWSIFGTPKQVRLEWSTDPDFDQLIRTDTTSLDSFVYKGLKCNNTYYLRVTQSGCTKSVKASVQMPFGMPFAESFDVDALPAAWTLMKGKASDAFAGTNPVVSTNSSWKITTSSVGLPANHMLGQLNKLSTQTDAWLVSPDLLISARPEESVFLDFDLALTASTSETKSPTSFANNAFRVLVSQDNGASWAEADSWLWSEAGAPYALLSSIPAAGMNVQLDLTAYVGKHIRIAFYKESSTATSSYLHVGNVKLRAMSANCMAPDSLQLVQAGLNTLDIKWQNATASPIVVEYATAPDFSLVQRDTVTESSHTITGLNSSTTYYIRVYQICGVGSDSEPSDILTATTALGLPYAAALDARGDWKCYRGALMETPSLTSVNTLKGWRTSATATILGGGHLYCAKDTATYWLISPEIDLTPNTTEPVIAMEMDLALTKSNTSAAVPDATKDNHFYAMISTDDGATWASADRWMWSEDAGADYDFQGMLGGTGKHFQVDITRFGGHKIRVALVMGGMPTTTTKGGCINVAHFAINALASGCFGIKSVAVSDIDTTAAITIVPADSAKQWQVAFGRKGMSVERMTIVPTTALTCTIGTLALNTEYDIYVRSICAEGDTSAWSVPVSFTTPLGLPYEEPFRGTLSDWTSYYGTPSLIFRNQETLHLVTSDKAGWRASANTSGALSEARIYCAKSDTAAFWLVSPTINLMPNKGDRYIYLNFDMALTSNGNTTTEPLVTTGHTFYVAVSDDDGLTWKEINSFLWGAAGKSDYLYSDIPAADGRTYHLDLTAFHGKSIRIAFIEGMAASGSSAIHINDVEMLEYDVPCFGVANLTAKYEYGVASCTLDPADESTHWQYALVRAGQVPTNADAKDIYATSFNIPSVPMSSTLHLYARSVCGDADTSSWAGPVEIITPLGVRYEEPMAWTTIDSRWSQYSYSSGRFTRTSSGYWYTKAPGQGFSTQHMYMNAYSTRECLLASPLIDLGSVGSKSIQLSFDMALTKYNNTTAPTSVAGQSFEIRISSDNGASWDDVMVWGEDAEADYIYSDIPTTGARYEVDLTEYAGDQIMLGFFSRSTGGCDNDIHLRNIVVDTLATGSVCIPIRRAVMVDSTFTTATMSLRAPGINDALDIEYFCVPEYSLFKPSLAMHSDTNIVTLKELQSSSSYDFYARQMCADSTWTEWAGPFLFSTVECTPISGLASASVTLHEASLTFLTPDADAAIGYQMFITEKGGVLDENKLLFSKTPTFRFSYDFQPSHEYDVYARKICQAGDTSAWCEPITVHAPYGVRYVDNLQWNTFSDEWTRYSGTLSSLTETTSGWSAGSRAGKGFEENHVYANIYSSYRYLMVSPEIDLSNLQDGAPLTLSVDVALTAYSSANAPSSYEGRDFYVLVSSNGTWSETNGWQFSEDNAMADYQLSAIPATGETFTFDMSDYVGQKVRVGFYGVARSGTADIDFHLRNVVIDTMAVSATCRGVARVAVDKADLHSAQVTCEMKDEVTAPVLYYEIGLDADFAMVALADTANSLTFTIDGLNASTIYYIRVRQLCSATDESAWSKTAVISTAKGVRYTEDFEGTTYTTEWAKANGYMDEIIAGTSELTTTTGSGLGTWSQVSAAKGMSSQHIRINVYGTSTRGWAISPAIDLTPNVGQALLFAFDAATATYSGDNEAAAAPDDIFAVAVSTDDGKSWTKENTFVWSDSDAVRTEGTYASMTMAPQRYVLDFSRFAGQTIKFAFYGESKRSNGDNYVMVDNIDLNATRQYTFTDTVCQGIDEDYDGYGFTLPADMKTAGMHHLSRISETMDSVIYLDLMILSSSVTEFTDTICEGETYTKHGYNLLPNGSGVYRRHLEAVNGCDSTILLNLTVNPIVRTQVKLYACRGTSYNLLGKAYYTNAVVRDTLTSASTGCDSVVTYYLYFSDEHMTEETEHIILCEGDTLWVNDSTFIDRAGYYNFSYQSMYGCDSILHFSVLEPDMTGAVYDTIFTNELPYVYNGVIRLKTDATPGDYTLSVVTSCGTVTPLHVTINGGTGWQDLYYDPRTGARKVIVNDHLYIIRDDCWFDPTGVRVK